MKVDTAPRRVVIDTNVWISAALSRHGAPARFVRQALERQVPIFSTATFAEFQQRLWRPKFDPYLSIELRNRILHDASLGAYDTACEEARSTGAEWLAMLRRRVLLERKCRFTVPMPAEERKQTSERQ